MSVMVPSQQKWESDLQGSQRTILTQHLSQQGEGMKLQGAQGCYNQILQNMGTRWIAQDVNVLKKDWGTDEGTLLSVEKELKKR